MACVAALALLWSGLTLHGEFNDANGAPANVVIATWMRDNGMGSIAAKLEDLYYRFVDTPQVGGEPTTSANLSAEDGAGAGLADLGKQAASSAITRGSGTPPPVLLHPGPDPSRPHLNPPPALASPAGTPEPMEGQWQPVASRVDGIPAVYATRVRVDSVHTSYYASLMWIDTTLTKAMFVPGYQEPGGPNPYDGALPTALWPEVLADFNGAFRLDDTMGGYYYQGTMVRPLVDGKAATAIYKDGSIRIGAWGRDLHMTADTVVVRQNLNLIVDHGRSQVSNGNDNVVWGATTDKTSLAWRAAIGQRADGSIVYVGSPYLSAADVARVLVDAGVKSAMVLDMNNWWVAGFYFRHTADGTPLCRKLDPAIQEGCDRFLHPYKRDSFQFLANPESPSRL